MIWQNFLKWDNAGAYIGDNYEDCSEETSRSAPNNSTISEFSCRSQPDAGTHKSLDYFFDENTKEYICKVCSYKSKCKTNVVVHFRTHSGFKPFKCEICNFVCTQRSSLTRHMRTHTQERPYICEYCHKTFTVSSNLKRHLLIHYF